MNRYRLRKQNGGWHDQETWQRRQSGRGIGRQTVLYLYWSEVTEGAFDWFMRQREPLVDRWGTAARQSFNIVDVWLTACFMGQRALIYFFFSCIEFLWGQYHIINHSLISLLFCSWQHTAYIKNQWCETGRKDTIFHYRPLAKKNKSTSRHRWPVRCSCILTFKIKVPAMILPAWAKTIFGHFLVIICFLQII